MFINAALAFWGDKLSQQGPILKSFKCRIKDCCMQRLDLKKLHMGMNHIPVIKRRKSKWASSNRVRWGLDALRSTSQQVAAETSQP